MAPPQPACLRLDQLRTLPGSPPLARRNRWLAASPTLVNDGSSPRTRGTDGPRSPGGSAGRFIPAHAGNRRTRPPAPSPSTVHPRARGEQAHAAPELAAPSGSSPRTRGTGADDVAEGVGARFIPAHAGNSATPPAAHHDRTVYPRARGEQKTTSKVSGQNGGSSPRTRGTDVENLVLLLGHRFIPAHAGNRSRPSGSSSAPTVHPRVRGEQGTRWTPSTK